MESHILKITQRRDEFVAVAKATDEVLRQLRAAVHKAEAQRADALACAKACELLIKDFTPSAPTNGQETQQTHQA